MSEDSVAVKPFGSKLSPQQVMLDAQQSEVLQNAKAVIVIVLDHHNTVRASFSTSPLADRLMMIKGCEVDMLTKAGWLAEPK